VCAAGGEMAERGFGYGRATGLSQMDGAGIMWLAVWICVSTYRLVGPAFQDRLFCIDSLLLTVNKIDSEYWMSLWAEIAEHPSCGR
jgi:hypothetical protein